MSSQLGPVFCEPVNRGEHFRKDALRADCLMVGKLRNVDTLLLHAQGRSPEQFINPRNHGVGHIHETTPGARKLSERAEARLPTCPGGCPWAQVCAHAGRRGWRPPLDRSRYS